MSRAHGLAEATPPDRDRYIDLLRVIALCVVMLGHFFMVAVVVEPDGSVEVSNALTTIVWAQWLTWVLQVMPVFFAVGGFSHAVGWASVTRRGGSYADFVAARVARLLRPTLVFIAIGATIGAVVEATDNLSSTATMILRVIPQPLWFIGIYLAVMLLAPTMLRLHRRWTWWVPVVLFTATASVDIARLAFDAPELIGYLNFAFVWLAVHQCGFFYADGVADRGGRRLAGVLAGMGLASTALLVLLGPYPVSMVTLPGDEVSNMTPPSLALLTLSLWLMGLALLVRPLLSPGLQRTGTWTVVVAANGVVLTAFLWHLAAVIATDGALVLLGAPVFPEVGSTQWWLLRIPLLLLTAAVLAVLVAGFRRSERPRRWEVPHAEHRYRHRDGLAALGAGLALVGILGLSVVGFAGVLSLRTATLVVVPAASLPSIALVVSGYWLTVHAASANSRGWPRHPPGVSDGIANGPAATHEQPDPGSHG